MYIHEHIAIRMAKERMEDALRSAEQLRDLRLTKTPRWPARVYLGLALIRIGRWLQGQPTSTPAAPVGLGRA